MFIFLQSLTKIIILVGEIHKKTFISSSNITDIFFLNSVRNYVIIIVEVEALAVVNV